MTLSRVFLLSVAAAALTAQLIPRVSAQSLRVHAAESTKMLSRKKTAFPFLENLFGKTKTRHLSSMHYSQIGDDIDGLTIDDSLANSVCMSKDGLRIAVAAPGEGAGRGATRVYDWNVTTEEWIQVGQIILGHAPNVGLGFSMDMNDDGSRIILGGPEAYGDNGFAQVYELGADSTWQQVGNNLLPEVNDGQAGVSVTINALGDIVAFGAPRTNEYSGRVTAFHLLDGQWSKLGNNMDCMEYYTYSGGSIAMDAEGKRLVVGGRLGSYYTGYTKVFEYRDAVSDWVEIAYFSGGDYYDRFGSDVDISSDGNRIVIGAFTSDGQNLGIHDAGEFCIMEYNGSSWNLVGQPIIGDAEMDQLGTSVIISGDGSHVAISAPGNDSDGLSNNGEVKVYKFSTEDNEWVQQGFDINGECDGDRLGEGGGALAMDYTGTYLAVGARRGRYYRGMTRVFEALAGVGDGSGGSTNFCE